MYRYQCGACNTLFDTPEIMRRNEPMPDGYFERCAYPVCPICGFDGLSEVKPCPNTTKDGYPCDKPMGKHEIICKDCRKDLLDRFIAFADKNLTAEEEEQLDSWLDGDTITNRRNWE